MRVVSNLFRLIWRQSKEYRGSYCLFFLLVFVSVLAKDAKFLLNNMIISIGLVAIFAYFIFSFFILIAFFIFVVGSKVRFLCFIRGDLNDFNRLYDEYLDF